VITLYGGNFDNIILLYFKNNQLQYCEYVKRYYTFLRSLLQFAIYFFSTEPEIRIQKIV